MGSYIRNDRQLTETISRFYERLSAKCDQTSNDGKYLASIAMTLSNQSDSLYANLSVSSYGVLEKVCKPDIPSFVKPELILKRVYKEIDTRRKAAIAFHGACISDFIPSEHAKRILSPDWPATKYGTIDERDNNAVIVLGKRHPNRIAREALKYAAQLQSNSVFEKALEALVWYILIDTSLLEVNERVRRLYALHIDYLGTAWLTEVLERFNPYAPHFNPRYDFRFREENITPSFIFSLER